MSDEARRPAAVPSLCYRDPIAAMAWLENAFGLERAVLVTDAEGKVAFAEMSFAGSPIGVMQEWESAVLLGPARMRSPLSIDGAATGFLRVSVDDVRALCERARAAGARITQEPTDQPYGERTCRALDLEGHVWNFTQSIRAMTGDEIEDATGLTIQPPRKPA